MYFMQARQLKKLEGKTFTFRSQANPQDSVRITNEAEVPMAFKRIEALVDGELWQTVINSVPAEVRQALADCVKGAHVQSDAIKEAKARSELVPGTEVYRGSHVRVA
jgi:hypothetical protein